MRICNLLSDINLWAVEAFKAEKLASGLGPKTVGNILALLKSMIRFP